MDNKEPELQIVEIESEPENKMDEVAIRTKLLEEKVNACIKRLKAREKIKSGNGTGSKL